jgi:sterol desaturase/sphingolipid hydroxylase (fatty acid hydroxylase superfamily)
MMLPDAIGHCGYELFPRGWADRPILGLVTMVTHHDMHHEHAPRNFGLYFTWWDRLMGTEHPDYRLRTKLRTPNNEMRSNLKGTYAS